MHNIFIDFIKLIKNFAQCKLIYFKLICALLIIIFKINISFSLDKSIISQCPELKSIYLPECNNLPFLEFLESKVNRLRPCKIAFHLGEFSEYLIKEKNLACSMVVYETQNRYYALTDTQNYNIEYQPYSWLGLTDAPIKITMYISMSCPLCKRIYGDLYDSLTSNKELYKMMKLGVLCFSDTRIDRALEGLSKSGKQADFLKKCSKVKERLSEKIIEQIANSLGINPIELWKQADAEETVLWVKKTRQEAIKNGVTVTPTFFINNKRYHSYKDARWVIDAVKYILKE
jgi:protein-disulfide isomerase